MPGTRHAANSVRIIIALVGIAAIVVLADQAKPDLFPKRFHEVEAGRIYRSGKLTPGAFRAVVEGAGIKTIVDLGAWEPETPEEALAVATARELGVDRVIFDLEGDATGDPNAYLKTLRIMNDPARQPVLVHCGAGTERTGCAILLQRHLVEGVALDDAYEEAKRIGHSPSRNPRFQEVLDRWLAPITEAYENDLETVPGTDDE